MSLLCPRFSRRARAALRTDPLELRTFPSGITVLLPVIDVVPEAQAGASNNELLAISEPTRSEDSVAEPSVAINLTDVPAAIAQSLADRFPGATIKTLHSTIENGVHSYDVALVAADSGLLDVSIGDDGIIESVEQADQSEDEPDLTARASGFISVLSMGSSNTHGPVVTAAVIRTDSDQNIARSSAQVTPEETESRLTTQVAPAQISASVGEAEDLMSLRLDFDESSRTVNRRVEATSEFTMGSELKSILHPCFAGMLTTLCPLDFHSIDRAFSEFMNDLDASINVSTNGRVNVTFQLIMITVGLVGIEYVRREAWTTYNHSPAISGARTPKQWRRPDSALVVGRSL